MSEEVTIVFSTNYSEIQFNHYTKTLDAKIVEWSVKWKMSVNECEDCFMMGLSLSWLNP